MESHVADISVLVQEVSGPNHCFQFHIQLFQTRCELRVECLEVPVIHEFYYTIEASYESKPWLAHAPHHFFILKQPWELTICLVYMFP